MQTFERQSALAKSGATSAQAADDASAQRDAAVVLHLTALYKALGGGWEE